MVAPTVYKSTDSSAPTISGTAGDLIAALYAILVTGYGSKAAAGWTRPYTGTNKAVFQQGGGLGRCLRIDDSNAFSARPSLYTTMTSVDAGDHLAPAGTLPYWHKSTVSSSTQRPWVCLATAQTFYLIILANLTSLGNGDGGDSHCACGDFVDPAPACGLSRTFLIGAITTTPATSFSYSQHVLVSNGTTINGHYAIGDISGFVLGNTHPFGKRACGSNSSPPISGLSTLVAYPDGPTGGLNISRFLAIGPQGSYNWLGWMPGLWFVHHEPTTLTSLDTFTGASGQDIDGNSFLIVRTGGASGLLVFQTDGGWS